MPFIIYTFNNFSGDSNSKIRYGIVNAIRFYKRQESGADVTKVIDNACIDPIQKIRLHALGFYTKYNVPANEAIQTLNNKLKHAKPDARKDIEATIQTIKKKKQ